MKIRHLLPLFAFLSVTGALCADDHHTKGDAVAQVSQGAEINLADYVVPGKTTIFDFSSDFCGPCRRFTAPLAHLHTQRADIAVVRVDINRPGLRGIDWASPVAKEFQLQSIPHFKVFGPDGKMLAGDGPDSYAGRTMVAKLLGEIGETAP